MSSHVQLRAHLLAALAILGNRPSNPVAEFIAARCHEVPGGLVLFSNFFDQFMDWLPREDRKHWSKLRLSRELPADHPSGAYTANKKFIANLSFEPMLPSEPYVAIDGGARVHCKRILRKA